MRLRLPTTLPLEVEDLVQRIKSSALRLKFIVNLGQMVEYRGRVLSVVN